MKNRHLLIAGLLFVAAAISCELSCRSTRKQIIHDLNNALEATVRQHPSRILTPDTVALFRSNLTIKELKDSSYVAYCLKTDKPSGLCSEPIALEEGIVRGYAYISTASIISISDKKLPTALTLMALIWMSGALWMERRKIQPAVAGPANLTPMQRQLMEMFLAAPDNILSRQQICEALWPGKPDPEETLYSLIRHLKSTLKDSQDFHIETIRGYGYKLTKR